MSFVLALAAPTTPEIASLVPANDARSEPSRSPTFGPTLSDARERLSSTQARRADPMDHRSRQPQPWERSTRPDPVDRDDRPAPDDNEPARPDSVDGRSDRRTDRRADDSRDDDTTTTTDSTAAAERPDSEDSTDENAAAAGSLAVLSNILPTAKGATGVDGSSIDLTIEGAIAPDSLGAAANTLMIDDGVTLADVEALTGATTDPGATDAAAMGRLAALTSLENVSDADLQLAERIGSEATEEVAGPLVLSETDTGADPLTEAQADALANDAVLDGRLDEITAESGEAADASAELVDEAAPTATNGPIADGDAVNRPTQQASIGTVTRQDGTNSVVVAARDAAAAPENVRAGPTATTPASAALPEAEANLWEDVRSAFERIRATGDGQEVRMRLRPAELGELLVQVRTQGEHVSVRLVASSAAAQQTLMDDRVRLAAELARAGFDEGSVDIGQSNTGDTSQRGNESGNESGDDRRSIGDVIGVDRLGSPRETFERREPIRTDIGFRPGRTAQSTINLTL